MLRTSTLWKLLSLSLLVHAGAAVAQQKPSEAPPGVQVEEGPNTTSGQPRNGPITVSPRPTPAKPAITERREGGRVTEVTVKSGPSEYTLKPNMPAGNAQPGDVQSNGASRGPQWTVLEFDLNKRKKPVEGEAAADAPPPPTATPAKAQKQAK